MNTAFSLKEQKIDKLFFIQKNLQTCIAQQKAFAFWQIPNQSTQHLIINLKDKIHVGKLDLEESTQGFAVSPFQNENMQNTYFISADLHYSFTNDKNNFEEKQVKTNTNPHQFSRFFEALNQNIQDKKLFQLQDFLPDKAISTVNQATHYQAIIQEAIKAIESNQFKKVVLSRTEALHYPIGFDLAAVFQKLCATYTTAFCYLFHIPQIGTWMGASPEILISTDKNQIFRTVALAGTQAYNPAKKLSESLWSQKEIEEQAMVSRYIINCFKKIRLREFEEEGPKSVVAGNLLHLKTFFSADMQAVNFPQLGTVMLDLLHPTSAVCGMPKAEALDFILKNENYAREFYSGFLGPVNIENESHIFVNLRCLQLLKNHIVLYAGAGVTEDSIPEKEWNETEMKCETMRTILM